jgi:hypothetical protein
MQGTRAERAPLGTAGAQFFAAATLAGWLERRPAWHWAIFLLACILPAGLCAYWKPLTSDEMFTFEIARLPDASTVWRALRDGADFHPPLDFLLRHFSMKAFGENEVAFRLPSMAALWAALWGIYSFVARRTSALYGLIAALIPLSTPVFEFGYEGRGYSLLVALAAGALAAWQRRTEGSRFALLPLAACLAGGVWAHYYGLLVFGPIALGELLRTRARGRMDWGAWGAMAAAGAALLPLLPFVQAARAFGGTYWTKVGILQALTIYSTLMDRLCIPAAAILAALLPTGLLARARGGRRRAPSFELAAVAGFVLLPLAAYVMAKAGTGALVARYVLPTAVGLIMGLAFAAWETVGGSAPVGMVMAAVLAVSGLGGEAAFAWKQRQLSREFHGASLADSVRGLDGPIVMTDNDLLMQLWHYERPEIAERLVFLADLKGAAEYQGYNTIELLFPRLARWSNAVHVLPYTDFVQQHRRFLLVDTLRGYVARLLIREGATLTAKGAYRDKWVFEVERGGEAPEGRGITGGSLSMGKEEESGR